MKEIFIKDLLRTQDTTVKNEYMSEITNMHDTN